jgi:hypothetical protein
MKTIIVFAAIIVCEMAVGQEDHKSIDIGARGEVEFILIDPSGRREGIDPRSGLRFREINNSYGVFSLDSEDPEIEAPPPVIEFITYSPLRGEYALTVVGVGRSQYSVAITLAWARASGAVMKVEGVIDSLQAVKYVIRYDSTKTNSSVKKIVVEGSLRQDLDNCYKLTLLGARQLYDDLSHRVDKYEEYVRENESSKARLELEKFSGKLDDVYAKTKGPSRDPNHFLSDTAYRILKEDVQGLMKRE